MKHDGETDDLVPGLIVPFGRTKGRAGFDTWSDMVSIVFDAEAPPEAVADFTFGSSSWHLGQLVLTECESVAHRFTRSSRTIARGGIDHYLVQVYRRGHFSGYAEGTDLEMDSGDVWIVDLSRPAGTVTSAFNNVSLVIPRDLLAPLVSDPDALHGLRLAGDSPLGGLLRHYLLDLASRAPRLTNAEALAIAPSVAHVVAGCFGPSIAAAEGARERLTDVKLSRIRDYIEANLADPALGVASVCGQFGLSRAALYRLFEPHGGVHDYISRRRLRRCFNEIVGSEHRTRRLSEIAYGWGFTNEDTFRRTFRRSFGLSPGEARAAGRAAVGQALAGAPRERALGQWIRNLGAT